MTNAELQAILKEYPDDAPIYFIYHYSKEKDPRCEFLDRALLNPANEICLIGEDYDQY